MPSVRALKYSSFDRLTVTCRIGRATNGIILSLHQLFLTSRPIIITNRRLQILIQAVFQSTVTVFLQAQIQICAIIIFSRLHRFYRVVAIIMFQNRIQISTVLPIIPSHMRIRIQIISYYNVLQRFLRLGAKKLIRRTTTFTTNLNLMRCHLLRLVMFRQCI